MRSTKFSWVGKHINVIMKPTLANPRKTRLKVALGPLFPTANNFSWVGIDFIQETEYEAQPNQSLRKHLIIT